MKAEIIETKKKFEPIEIKLVIESEEDLCDLWHRANADHIELAMICPDDLPYFPTEMGCLGLFNVLERIVDDFNLRR